VHRGTRAMGVVGARDTGQLRVMNMCTKEKNRGPARRDTMPTGACRHGLVRDVGCARDVYMRLEEDNTSYFSW
jgi:hypothetical protein